MSGEDRQSQLAREHKERQVRRSAEQSAKAKRNTFIGAGVAVAVVAGGVFAATTLVGSDSGKPVAAESSPSPSASASASAPVTLPSSAPKRTGPVKCTYRRTKDADVPMKYVGLPGAKPNLKLSTMTIATNHGNIVIDVDANATPCAINSMAFLAKKGFYDNTKCHRLATAETAGIYILQCGDPLAKADGKNPTDGQGTAGYLFDDENLGTVPYNRGAVFLTQPVGDGNQNSSQFAVSLADENAAIQDPYTVIGMVRSGLEIIDKVAEQGVIVNKDDIVGDGGSTAPKNPIIIKKVTLS